MTTTSTGGIDWSERAVAHLLDVQTCPICVSARLVAGRCPECGVDLTGRAGADLWAASVEAARVLRDRASLQRGALLTRTPEAQTSARVPAPPAGMAAPAAPTVTAQQVSGTDAAATAPAAAFPPPADQPAATAQPAPVTAPAVQPASVTAPAARPAPSAFPAPDARPSVVPSALPAPATPTNPGASLQSVLATAGAALFAVAAIVFTFFNPDLADRTVRSIIIGAVTLIFLAGAWLLARRRLQSSAEAVGGLGLVFVGLDVQAVAGTWSDGTTSWTAAAIATGVAGGLLLAAALRARIRIWLWASLPGLAAVPAMLGAASGDDLVSALLIAASAFAGMGLCALLPRFAARFPSPGPDAQGRPRRALAAEAIILTVVQVGVGVIAIGRISFTEHGRFAVALVLAVLAVQAVLAARYVMPRTWAFLGGVLGAAAGALAGAGLAPDTNSEWMIPAIVAGAAVVFVGTAVVLLPARTPRRFLAVGSGIALGLLSGPAVLGGLIVGSTLLRGAAETAQPYPLSETTLPAVVALAVVAVAFAGFGLCAALREDTRRLVVLAHSLAVVYGTEVVLALGCSRLLTLPASIAVVLSAAAAVGVILVIVGGRAAVAVRALLIAGAHLALVVAALLSWGDAAIVPIAGAAALVVLGLLARTVPQTFRFLHVGAGCAYALVLIATALSNAGVEGIARFSLTASAGLLGAIAATFVPRIDARAWLTVLVVATVPFGLGVLQVVNERSGWTALSTGLMFVLALALLLTRRPGLTEPVRVIAAGLLVPTLAVVVVCLSAQLLAQSGSPVALPVIAVLVAAALPSSLMIRDGLVARGRTAETADAARVAIEASALLTGVIAVGLALQREAAGLGTSCLVLLIIGAGALAAAMLSGRRYGWWVAAASFTGALWSIWGLAGVDLPEAYLLPPTLGAAVIGVVLTLRGVRAKALFASALAAAVLPLDVLLAVDERTAGAPWRAYGLLLAAAALIVASAVIRRAAGSRMRRLHTLIGPSLAAAAVAALAGTIQAVRWGAGEDAAPFGATPPAVFAACAALSAVGALGVLAASLLLRAISAGRQSGGEFAPDADGERALPGIASLRRLLASRWLGAPALLAFAVGVWPAIARDWFVIWAMWSLMLAVLALMVRAASSRGRMLPPPLFLFAVAFVTAVVAWSPRDLRVEWFSLPLGAFLILAGALGLHRRELIGRPHLSDWPRGWAGSWPLLAPGLIVMMSASIVSTFTDPLTWRAILVMVLALAAILVGASRRLSAPFILGLIVLPVENVFVFSVQLGRGIESMPWWITLATIGAVLLIIAVAGERREGAGRGVVARMRDLR